MGDTQGDQGTGKHPHKDSEQPWPHTEGAQHRGSGEERSFNSDNSGGKSRSASSGSSEEESLKDREYRGADGQVHHHTRTYEEQHKDRG